MADAEPAARPAPPPDDENTPEYREWLAAAYDTDVYEQWHKPFEDLLHNRLEPVAKGMVLEVGCATGRGTARLMKALGERVRLVAQEDRGFLLDLARARLGDSVGSRLFFNSDPLPKLRYDAKVFSTVISNLGWWERADRNSLLAEMTRVLDDEGLVVLTAPLAGTFAELIDLAREVAVKLDLVPKLEPRIAALEAMFLTPEDWAAEVEAAGLTGVRVDCDEVEMPFGSSREMFSSTVAQARWLSLWRRGFGEEDKRLVWHIRQMIDAYWADAKFKLTVAAGCLTARRPKGFVPRKVVERPAAAGKAEEAVVPVVLAGESDVDKPPARPATIPPSSGSEYYASGDAIAAELLGGATEASEFDRTVEESPEDIQTVEPEPTESEGGEPEAVEAEPLDEELEPDSGIVPPESLDEAEPYVPDEGDLHPGAAGGSRPPGAPIDTSILDDGSGVEHSAALEPPGSARGEPRTSNPPAVSPVPLGRPHAGPVRPLDLGQPEARRVRPVELNDSPEEPEEEFISEWFKGKK